MDAFSGYNQIGMDPDDQEKISFVIGARDLLLSCDALWAQERRSHLLEAGKQDVPEENRSIHGGVYR